MRSDTKPWLKSIIACVAQHADTYGRSAILKFGETVSRHAGGNITHAVGPPSLDKKNRSMILSAGKTVSLFVLAVSEESCSINLLLTA